MLSNRFSLNHQFSLPLLSQGRSFSQTQLIDAEVQELLKKGAMQEVKPSDYAFYSRLFLVPRKQCTYWPVMEFSSFNSFVSHVHFQMEGLHCLKTLLRKGDYMTSIDLKDTYFSVPIHNSSQGFLGFIWGTKHYAFLGLPFRSQISTPNIHQAP